MTCAGPRTWVMRSPQASNAATVHCPVRNEPLHRSRAVRMTVVRPGQFLLVVGSSPFSPIRTLPRVTRDRRETATSGAPARPLDRMPTPRNEPRTARPTVAKPTVVERKSHGQMSQSPGARSPVPDRKSRIRACPARPAAPQTVFHVKHANISTRKQPDSHRPGG